MYLSLLSLSDAIASGGQSYSSGQSPLLEISSTFASLFSVGDRF
ncbi:hypothetical protein [Novipirellula sp.]